MFPYSTLNRKHTNTQKQKQYIFRLAIRHHMTCKRNSHSQRGQGLEPLEGVRCHLPDLVVTQITEKKTQRKDQGTNAPLFFFIFQSVGLVFTATLLLFRLPSQSYIPFRPSGGRGTKTRPLFQPLKTSLQRAPAPAWRCQ